MAINEVKTADGTTLMSVVDDTVTEEALLAGYTATDASGNKIEGKLAVSNPNLLINSDFSINQRGDTLYDTAGYTVDRWSLQKMTSAPAIGSVYVSSDGGVILTAPASVQSVRFMQRLERQIAEGTTVTMSVEVDTIDGTWVLSQFGGIGRLTLTSPGVHSFTTTWSASGSAINAVVLYNSSTVDTEIYIKAIKLEFGEVATQIQPCDPSIELLRCQRYYQIRSTSDIYAEDLRPSMRVAPTVTQLADGNYAYSAEL